MISHLTPVVGLAKDAQIQLSYCLGWGKSQSDTVYPRGRLSLVTPTSGLTPSGPKGPRSKCHTVFPVGGANHFPLFAT